MNRRFWVWLHRWAGLAMTIFLVIVGLTGSLLVFNSELEQWISPQLFPAPRTDVPLLSLAELAVRTEALMPQARVTGVQMGEPGWRWISVEPQTDPATGKPFALAFNQILLDPYTGEELARREWGAISQGWINLMPFIYSLHFELALSTWGMWTLGITALIWTLDSFVGFYLTLPSRRIPRTTEPGSSTATSPSRSFWKRWEPAWQVKWTSTFRINFDLHRAGGLWLWIVLLIFAWSSVYMNLWDTVYTWATRAVFEYKASWTELAPRAAPLEQPALGWREAQEIGDRLMAEQARQHGFTVERPISLGLDREHGVYQYSVRSSLDIHDHDRRGMTQLFFDADTGALTLLLLPTGQYTGNTVTAWLYALHMANVFGLPYRIFVCAFGLVVIMLSVTGVVIWWKKRRARLYRRGHVVPPIDIQDIDNNLQFTEFQPGGRK